MPRDEDIRGDLSIESSCGVVKAEVPVTGLTSSEDGKHWSNSCRAHFPCVTSGLGMRQNVATRSFTKTRSPSPRHSQDLATPFQRIPGSLVARQLGAVKGSVQGQAGLKRDVVDIVADVRRRRSLLD